MGGDCRDCNSDEECIPATSCKQYAEDSDRLGFIPSGSKREEISSKLDSQICVPFSRGGQEKVCCKTEDKEFKINSGRTVDVNKPPTTTGVLSSTRRSSNISPIGLRQCKQGFIFSKVL